MMFHLHQCIVSELNYQDRFLHILNSEISGNQYALATSHYSNFSHMDGSIVIRQEQVKHRRCFTESASQHDAVLAGEIVAAEVQD